MNKRNKSKTGTRKLAGVIIAAMIVASLAGIFAHAFGREVPIPDGEKGIYFLDPKDSSAPEKGKNVTIDIWVNTSLTGAVPAQDYLLTGKVTIETADKACANITSCKINTTEWPSNPVARILEGGKKAQLTYSVYMGAPGKPPGCYNVGTITVECNSSTYCIADLNFVPTTYIGNLSTYYIHGENGTFTCEIKMPAPNITSSAPSSPVTDYSGATRTFNITIDQPVNVSWLINGTVVKDSEKGVTEASYTNTSAVVGTWNVSAVVENANGTDMQTWIWNVMAPPVLVNEFLANPGAGDEWIFQSPCLSRIPGSDQVRVKVYGFEGFPQNHGAQQLTVIQDAQRREIGVLAAHMGLRIAVHDSLIRQHGCRHGRLPGSGSDESIVVL